MHTLETETGCAIVLTRAELAALCGFAARDPASTLSYAFFDPGKGTACAADGHRLVRATFGARPGAEAFLVDIDHLDWLVEHAYERVGEKRKASDLWIVVDASEGRLVTATPHYVNHVTEIRLKEVARVAFEPVGHTRFPDFEQVIPKYHRRAAGVSQAFNGRYLADAAKLLGAAACMLNKKVRVFPARSSLDPLVVEAQGHGIREHGPLPTKWTAAIMPDRDGDDYPGHSVEKCVDAATAQAVS